MYRDGILFDWYAVAFMGRLKEIEGYLLPIVVDPTILGGTRAEHQSLLSHRNWQIARA